MRASILIGSLAIATLAPLNSPAQAMTTPSATRTEEQCVLAFEDEYVAAEVRRDEAALRRLVDDRFVYNSSNGKTSDKEALIRSLLKAPMVSQTIHPASHPLAHSSLLQPRPR